MFIYQNGIRYTEKKYILNEGQYREFIAQIYLKMQYDSYKKYRMYSLFFNASRFKMTMALLQGKGPTEELAPPAEADGGGKAAILPPPRQPEKKLPAEKKVIKPSLYLVYDRLVMEGKGEEDLTITFDTNFLWLDQQDRTGGERPKISASTGQYVMRIRYGRQMPSWLCDALTMQQIHPKYLPEDER